MKKLQILMSTYNGEKYINEQMDSLLVQDYNSYEILVRDDGSTDRTLNILEEYKQKTDRLAIIKGRNIGVVRSFFNLVQESKKDVHYLAFCDQDDVWKKDKISRAVQLIESDGNNNVPIMYCSITINVDEMLNIISLSETPNREPSLKNALVQNIATGCTIVINKQARDLLLQKLPDYKYVLMHDWWIYMVISAFGKVVFDKESRILYRQHSTNVIGATRGLLDKWKKRLERQIKNNGTSLMTKQAEEFYRLYQSKLDSNLKKTIDKFVNQRKGALERLIYSITCDVYRQTTIDDIMLRFLILLNRI
jgi:glycosyltransferase involved in cell wall biosynthesis